MKFHKCSEPLNEDSQFNVVTHSGKSIQINYAREEEPTCKCAGLTLVKKHAHKRQSSLGISISRKYLREMDQKVMMSYHWAMSTAVKVR